MKCPRAEEIRIQEVYERRAALDSRYSCFQSAHLFTLQQLDRSLLSALQEHDFDSLSSRRILEIGCGNGHWLRQFVQWGARPENLTGVDLLEARLSEAIDLCPAKVQLHRMNATSLSFANASFDITFQATVFTSVLDADLRKRMAAEMIRVTSDTGLILWYDFRVNNPKNPDVRGINADEIYELFAGCQVDLRGNTLAPPIARRIAPYSWLACHLLSKIPALCSHYVAVIRPKPNGSR